MSAYQLLFYLPGWRNGEAVALARETETQAVLDFVEHQVLAAARPEGQEGVVSPS